MQHVHISLAQQPRGLKCWPLPKYSWGALDCRASTINETMNLAAARAIAGLVTGVELNAENIISSVFDRRVAPAVAAAVAVAVEESGVDRKERHD